MRFLLGLDRKESDRFAVEPPEKASADSPILPRKQHCAGQGARRKDDFRVISVSAGKRNESSYGDGRSFRCNGMERTRSCGYGVEEVFVAQFLRGTGHFFDPAHGASAARAKDLPFRDRLGLGPQFNSRFEQELKPFQAGSRSGPAFGRVTESPQGTAASAAEGLAGIALKCATVPLKPSRVGDVPILVKTLRGLQLVG